MQRKIMLSLALVGVLAAAQNEVELKSLEGVTVTAQRSSQSVDEISKSVPELIREAPGVSIVNEGMDSGTANVRGFSSSDYRVRCS